ncbi:MAG: hypothetical protein HOO13_03800 [Nitrosomonadales bacterium]|mgnify:FL=1|jgi:hypothetical protein|nr:hypothetical protein [Nitrosomonadales bacterium]MBT6390733.1 hypothetical protein [Candidatus Neomarinimicrobiota bacterium]
MKKKNFNLISGIRALLSPQQMSDLLQAIYKKYKKNEDKIKKSEKGLKKGPRARGKQLNQTAKQDKKILLAQAKVLKKQNPNINRKMLAFKLAEFSKNFNKVGLSKSFSESYIYQYILKKSS